MVRVAESEKQTTPFVERRYWADLSVRDIITFSLLGLTLLSLLWVLWNQAQQERLLAAISGKLAQQDTQLSSLSQQLTDHEQNRAAAESKRSSSPTTIVVPPPPASGVTTPTGPLPTTTAPDGTAR